MAFLDYSNYEKHIVFCVDMRSFYASCECVDRKLDPMKTKLAVVSNENHQGSVILASSPALKKLGIKTGNRLYEITKLKDHSIHIAPARLGFYYNISNQIIGILETFVPENAIHVYSVDEAWLTLDGTERLYKGKTKKEIAKLIINEIHKKTGIPATIGIGPNKFLAKTALDIYAKQQGIYEIDYKDVEKELHHVDIGEMWGVGPQLKKRFAYLNIKTYGDLARYDPREIKKIFGKNGEKLQNFAWGIDESPVLYEGINIPSSAFNFHTSKDNSMKSMGNGVTLLEDYTNIKDIRTVILDLAEEVSVRLRKRNLVGKTISLSVGYSKKTNITGFSRQKTLDEYTNQATDIANICVELFLKYSVSSPKVRNIRIEVTKLKEQTNKNILIQTLDQINDKYGKGTLRKAIAYTEKSIATDRSGKINGHKK